MELTTQQQETLSKLENSLSEELWDQVYYGTNPNPELISLYKEGVEVTFQVSLTPYVGRENKDWKD